MRATALASRYGGRRSYERKDRALIAPGCESLCFGEGDRRGFRGQEYRSCECNHSAHIEQSWLADSPEATALPVVAGGGLGFVSELEALATPLPSIRSRGAAYLPDDARQADELPPLSLAGTDPTAKHSTFLYPHLPTDLLTADRDCSLNTRQQTVDEPNGTHDVCSARGPVRRTQGLPASELTAAREARHLRLVSRRACPFCLPLVHLFGEN